MLVNQPTDSRAEGFFLFRALGRDVSFRQATRVLPYAYRSRLDTWTPIQLRNMDVKALKLTSTEIEDMWKGRLRCRSQCRCGYHAYIASTCWKLRQTSNISYAVRNSTRDPYLQFTCPEGLRWILDQAASEVTCGAILAAYSLHGTVLEVPCTPAIM